ncbi:MAG TPA: hypothetical protein VD884_10495 [Ohtaekwangia sp.]|nr:hypothetical protein [Ohtaekwangia sp.]
MVKKVLLGFCFYILSTVLYAQVDFNKQYFNAKQFFREGKYNLAMESFKPLIPYDQRNPFSEYASFYYAISAYHQGYRSVAKDQLNQLKKLYPKWEKINEVNFWLGKIYLDDRDYFQGIKMFASINDKKFQKDIDAAKTVSLASVADIETVKMMHEEFPKDKVVAQRLAKLLTNDLSDDANKALLENLIDNFSLKRAEYFIEAPKSVKKEIYSVSVMMPFMLKDLQPTPGKKRNQIIIDFYEGVQLAVDTLNQQKPQISLRAYDTQRSTSHIESVLNTEELKNTDLIIGPFFPDENDIIQKFSAEQSINVISPFLNNSEYIADNPFGFLYQPSVETVGKKSGEFLAAYAKRKNCLVFYGSTKRDSVLAANFIQSANLNGLQIVASKMISKDNVRSILATLTTATEYDEFKYPKEFTLKKDSIGSIFVASDDPLIYAKVISGIETRGDQIIVLGSENWLDHTVVDFEKYQTLPIVLASPNFTSSQDPEYRAFVKNFIRVHGRAPSKHARMGYDLMLFAGTQLQQHGVYFQEELNKQDFIPGFLSEGYNFKFSRNNQLVPFVRYEDGAMRVIDKR